ncbi:unnamed protein product [Closterium sp. Yama58-4]|nr:unnamed protein product [Closterium sp. Yama58-4]
MTIAISSFESFPCRCYFSLPSLTASVIITSPSPFSRLIPPTTNPPVLLLATPIATPPQAAANSVSASNRIPAAAALLARSAIPGPTPIANIPLFPSASPATTISGGGAGSDVTPLASAAASLSATQKTASAAPHMPSAPASTPSAIFPPAASTIVPAKKTATAAAVAPAPAPRSTSAPPKSPPAMTRGGKAGAVSLERAPVGAAILLNAVKAAGLRARASACVFVAEKREFVLVEGLSTLVPLNSTDAWAPPIGRKVLTNDCQFLIDATCQDVTPTGGCDDHNECTTDTCVPADPATCLPYPDCLLAGPSCSYTASPDSVTNPDCIAPPTPPSAPKGAVSSASANVSAGDGGSEGEGGGSGEGDGKDGETGENAGTADSDTEGKGKAESEEGEQKGAGDASELDGGDAYNEYDTGDNNEDGSDDTIEIVGTMPPPRSACIFIPHKNRFMIRLKNRFRVRLSASDAWAPRPGQVAMTGNCRFIIDSACGVVGRPGGCNDGDECTEDYCLWQGGNNTIGSCTPFPSCFYESARCERRVKEECIGGGGGGEVGDGGFAAGGGKGIRTVTSAGAAVTGGAGGTGGADGAGDDGGGDTGESVTQANGNSAATDGKESSSNGGGDGGGMSTEEIEALEEEALAQRQAHGQGEQQQPASDQDDSPGSAESGSEDPDLLDPRLRAPLPRPACLFRPKEGLFVRVEGWPFSARLSRADAWAPPPAATTLSGDCRFELDSFCSVVSRVARGCDDGDACTLDTCAWAGRANRVGSCEPFPSCFYSSAFCVHTDLCGRTAGNGTRGRGGVVKETMVGGGGVGVDSDGGSGGGAAADGLDADTDSDGDSTGADGAADADGDSDSTDADGDGDGGADEVNDPYSDPPDQEWPNFQIYPPPKSGSVVEASQNNSSGAGGGTSNATTTQDVLRTLSQPIPVTDTSVSGSFNVYHFGALGDGQNDDGEAIEAAFNEACKWARQNNAKATVTIPDGADFLTTPMVFLGPCGPGVIFLLDGRILAPNMPVSSYQSAYSVAAHLYFDRVTGLTVTSSGQGRQAGSFDGQGLETWREHLSLGQPDSYARPKGFLFHKCDNLVIEQITVRNPPETHISIQECNNVIVQEVTAMSPYNSPGTDGLHLAAATNVIIRNCRMHTGGNGIAIVDKSANISISRVFSSAGRGIR